MLGISADKPSAQKKFKEKYDLPYSLLADEDKAVCNKYGVMKEKSMYGKKYMGIERTTFVISPEGRISAVLTGLKPDEHAAAAMAALKVAVSQRSSTAEDAKSAKKFTIPSSIASFATFAVNRLAECRVLIC